MTGRLDWLVDAPPEARDLLVGHLNARERTQATYHWKMWARPEQLPPPGDWRVWMILAGRGFGKTRSGAEWVRAVAERDPQARIALISSSLADARAVMIEGESGILARSPPDFAPQFEPSLKRLRFPNGAQALLYSAAEPESLRGPQHSHAWCDEIGKWPLSNDRAGRCWDNLLMGLRLGQDQRIVVTTTPRTVPLVQRLAGPCETGETVITRGSTFDNAVHLPARFIAAMKNEFAGSLLARQELLGELIGDIDGALWSRQLIERVRETPTQIEQGRVIVAVDPPASAHGDACGIVVAGLGADGLARVLADCSVERASPERWARAVANAAQEWRADRVIAEANQGGTMVESVLRAADRNLPVRLAYARRGKVARAEPVAALYEAGRVRHAGMFAQLEDQLCGMMPGGAYHGPGRSPDRADALVWALSELMLGRAGEPRVVKI